MLHKCYKLNLNYFEIMNDLDIPEIRYLESNPRYNEGELIQYIGYANVSLL